MTVINTDSHPKLIWRYLPWFKAKSVGTADKNRAYVITSIERKYNGVSFPLYPYLAMEKYRCRRDVS